MTKSQQTLQYEQVSLLDDESVVNLYAVSSRVLRERGLLGTVKKSIKQIYSKKPIDTPQEVFNRGKVKRQECHSILVDFLEEDWSFLFPGDFDNTRKYYVYYHTRPEFGKARYKKGDTTIEINGRPFYVGKGTGDRYKSKKRARSHLSIINSYLDAGVMEDALFHIFKDNLTESEALELEAKLITFFGTSAELDPKRVHFTGIKGGLLCNSDPAKRPGCVEKMMRVIGGGYGDKI